MSHAREKLVSHSRLRAAFVMETHLGHRTYFENLRRGVRAHSQVNADWIPVAYADEPRRWSPTVWMPAQLRGALNGRREVRQGLEQAAADSGYDVAVFNTQAPAVLGGAPVRRQPYILCTDITPRQYDAMAHEYGHRPDGIGPIARFKHRSNVRLFRQAARLLPWSNWVRDSLLDDYGVDPSRVEVLPPGVDTERWRPADDTRQPGPVRVLFVGGDFYRKGGEELLHAWAALPAGSAELVVVTRTELPERPGVTVHTGLEPNSPALIAHYQTSDLFVFPTRAEAFGIAAVEATAAGLPVIATRVGGLPDIVRDGETGLLIEPDDQDGLGRALRQLVDDETLRTRLGAAARQRAVVRFDATRNAARMVAVMEQVCAGAAAVDPKGAHQSAPEGAVQW